ncbi:MAG: suppressor of fused domain protein [Rhodanobacteraceae bacterium]|nr:suppressor of fused domain protein [Rhodanobacteraceae bacterium]
MKTSNYQSALHKHLCRYFSGARLRNDSWSESQVTSVLPEFQVVEIAPNRVNASWVYVTSGIGGKGVPEDKRCEFLICANENNAENVKLLSMLAWYHLTGATLGEGHVLNIGSSWVPGSTLCSVLICRLWQFGDKLEIVRPREHHVHIYWVLPVTNDEGAFALAHGYQELERLFEDNRIQYTDPMRGSVLCTRRVDA